MVHQPGREINREHTGLPREHRNHKYFTVPGTIGAPAAEISDFSNTPRLALDAAEEQPARNTAEPPPPRSLPLPPFPAPQLNAESLARSVSKFGAALTQKRKPASLVHTTQFLKRSSTTQSVWSSSKAKQEA